MEYQNFFKGKKVTLLGLGLLGRGVGDAKFLVKHGAELTVTDLKKEEELAESLKELEGLKNIKLVLGRHELEDFRNADMIIKGAGVPLDSPYIKEASLHNIPVHMSTALFAKFFTEQFKGTVVGVTGTRGKSTVSHLIYHILKESGKSVSIGGNIQGVSTLSMIQEVKPNSIVVLEIDSWQLQGFGYEKMSPHISIFTTIFPDHMNYYKDDMDEYISDKASIFLYQSLEDTLIIGEQAFETIQKAYKDRIRSHIIKAETRNFPNDWFLKIPGEHNKMNALCAIEAAKVLGIPREDIKSALETFLGVAGRLELIGEKRGVGDVKIYNDTTSTTPEAAISGLKALDPKNIRNIILICGGADKNLDMAEFTREAKIHAKKIILLSGSGTLRIKDEFLEAPVYDSLEEAVRNAFDGAEHGDIILFSPAFASFGMFKNEYDRGEKFNKIVKELLN